MSKPNCQLGVNAIVPLDGLRSGPKLDQSPVEFRNGLAGRAAWNGHLWQKLSATETENDLWTGVLVKRVGC